MKQTVIEAIKEHKGLVARFEGTCVETVVACAELIVDSLKTGRCLYICGNGGSAADAQHIAGEFVGRFLKNRKPLPAVALTTDTSLITAIANDFSFDEIFTRQVEALVKPGDILWAFSTSGTSKNVVAAAKLAKQKGAKVIAFTGKANSVLGDISDACLALETNNSYSAQQIHQLAYHIICKIVEEELCG